MRSLTRIALLTTTAVLLVSCSLLPAVEAAAPGQCDPSKPETCSQGQRATLTPKGGGEPNLGEDEEPDWDPNAPRPDGMDGPDEIDVTDMSLHPVADGPDQDFSGAAVEIDLSAMEGNLTEEERKIPTTTDETNPENKDGEKDENPEDSLDEEEVDMAAYGEIHLRLETIANEYLCTTSAIPLYTMDGDADIWAMTSKILANQLQNMNQQYGAQIIEQWGNNRKANNFSCAEVQMFDDRLYDHPANILMEAKELLGRWLNKKDVDPAALTDHFIPHFRSMFSRWIVMRLMTFKKKQNKEAELAKMNSNTNEVEEEVYSEEEASEVKFLPDAIGTALVPLVVDEDSPSDTCFSGGGLHMLFIRGREEGHSNALTTVINQMLDVCFTTGKAADKPSEYAQTLMGTDREAEARELYKLAVERGELCHELQRPEQLHRKDLTARPVWPSTAIPELKKLVTLGQKMQAANTFEKLPFGNKTSQSSMLELKEGSADIIALYGGEDTHLHTSTCNLLGDEICNEFQSVINEILDSNDAYLFTCNETFSVDFWRVKGPAMTSSETGTANIVLQGFVPMETNDNTMMIRAGKEVVLVDNNEPVLIDDTFENYFEVLKADDGSNDKFINLIHVQLCHPELNDKALTVPGQKCAPAPTN